MSEQYATQSQIDSLYSAIIGLSDNVRDALLNSQTKLVSTNEAVVGIRRELDKLDKELSGMADDKRLDDVREDFRNVKERFDDLFQKQTTEITNQKIDLATLATTVQRLSTDFEIFKTDTDLRFNKVCGLLEAHLETYRKTVNPFITVLKERWKMISVIFAGVSGLCTFIAWGIKSGFLRKLFDAL